MVKGRRVRSVAVCAAPESCCSPPPQKRRGRRLVTEPMIAVLDIGPGKKRDKTEQNKQNTIDAFFQTVISDEMIMSGEEAVKTRRGRRPGAKCEVRTDRDDATTPGDDSCHGDEDDKAGVVALNGNGMRSPLTPHRIELLRQEEGKEFEEEEEEDEVEVEVVKKTVAAKKLNFPPPQIDCDPSTKPTAVKQPSRNPPPTLKNHKLTDYFPVRRSVRKTKTTVLEEKQRSLEHMLRNGIEDGLKVRYFDDKGRGVIAAKHFERGDYVVEYSGDLIDIAEAKRRENKYAQDKSTGCYMYYFRHNNQQYCVDATPESGKLGRLVNHSRNGNLITRTVMVDSKPRLVLIAKDEIAVGEEVTYDYGDRSKEALRHHPWLAY